MPDVRANGAKLHYIAAGGGEPVALIHGFTTDHAMWWRQVPELIRAGFHVVAHDVRGHGDSAKPEQGYELDRLVADLAALLDHLEIERAHVAGLSMGGIIAQRFCLDLPRRAATLALADTFPGRLDDDTLWIFQNHVEIARARGIGGLFDHLLEHPAMPIGPDATAPVEHLDAIKKNFMKNDLRALSSFVNMFAALPDWTDELGRMEAPALLLAGEFDKPCLEPMRKMAEVIPDAEFHVIERAGHTSPLEKPEIVNPLLIDFLRAHPIG